MRHHVFYLIMLLLACTKLYADSHRLGCFGEFGYSDMLTSVATNGHMGVISNIGGMYERQKNHFLFQMGIGVDYSFHAVYNSILNGGKPDMIDSDMDKCIYHYEITNKTDHTHLIHVTPCIMVGGEWKYLYFLAGMRVPLNIFGTMQTRGLLSATGEYDNLIVPLEAMQNHQFYTNADIFRKYTYSQPDWETFKPDIKIHIELGIPVSLLFNDYSPNSSIKKLHRIAFFAEYGLFDRKPANLVPLIDLHLSDNYIEHISLEDVEMHNLYASKEIHKKSLHSLVVGLRYSFLIILPQQQKCRCTNVYY